MKDKKALDEWMRKTISSNTEDLIRKSQDEINDIINMTINKIVTEQKIEKFVFIGIMLDWIKGDMKEDPRLIIDKLALLIKDSVSDALNRFKL